RRYHLGPEQASVWWDARLVQSETAHVHEPTRPHRVGSPHALIHVDTVEHADDVRDVEVVAGDLALVVEQGEAEKLDLDLRVLLQERLHSRGHHEISAGVRDDIGDSEALLLVR